MSTTMQDPAIRGYLDELRRLTTGAPDADLVVDGVTRHIEDALVEGPADPARIRAVLDELGDPAAIAAESAPDPAVRPPFLERRSGVVLIVLVLSFGGIVVPLLGWVVGLGLLWSSRAWRVRDKVVGTLAPVVGAALGLLIGWLLTTAGMLNGWAHLALLIGLLVGVVVGAVHLLRRAHPAPESAFVS